MAERTEPGAGPGPSAKTTFVEKPQRSLGFNWRLGLVIAWLAFSVALALWWMIFGLNQLERYSQMSGASPALAEEFTRQHRMLMSEGATLIVLLLAGGGALLYYINTELRRSQRVREFFAAFTHDLKTSLASLRLQAESLGEDLAQTSQEKLARRLIKDTVRLELQLENSLLLAAPEDGSRLFLEEIDLNEMLKGMSYHWPDLTIDVRGHGHVMADQRAVESVFKNLFQNACVHGRASRVDVELSRKDGRYISTRMTDNGRGFAGDRARLGTMFERHGTSSGSGLGLYIANELTRAMQGSLEFHSTKEGFSVEVVLLGEEPQR